MDLSLALHGSDPLHFPWSTTISADPAARAVGPLAFGELWRTPLPSDGCQVYPP